MEKRNNLTDYRNTGFEKDFEAQGLEYRFQQRRHEQSLAEKAKAYCNYHGSITFEPNIVQNLLNQKRIRGSLDSIVVSADSNFLVSIFAHESRPIVVCLRKAISYAKEKSFNLIFAQGIWFPHSARYVFEFYKKNS